MINQKRKRSHEQLLARKRQRIAIKLPDDMIIILFQYQYKQNPFLCVCKRWYNFLIRHVRINPQFIYGHCELYNSNRKKLKQ
jgi:hypothetical protein